MKIAFDFDGTLVDSMPALRKSAVSFISEAYDKSYEQADVWYMSTIGRSFREQIDFLFSGDKLNDEIARKFYDEHAKIYETVSLHFGVIETITELNSREIPYGIVSSSSESLIESAVTRLLPEFTGSIYGIESGTKREQLRAFNPSDFVGDTVYDCITSRRLGIRFTGVTHTFILNDVKRMGAPVADSIPSAVDLILNHNAAPESISQEPREAV